ncbi:phosphoheptose isomerase, partial [Vibrio harveyi]
SRRIIEIESLEI